MGELVQEVYRQAYKATDKQTLAERRQKLQKILMNSIDSDESKDEAMATANHVTNIIRLLVTSKDFRSLINDLETIFEQAFVVDEDKTQKSSENKTPESTQDTTLLMDPVTTSNTMGVHAPTGTLGSNSRT